MYFANTAAWGEDINIMIGFDNLALNLLKKILMVYKIHKIIDDHSAFLKQTYDETLKKFGAKNIDWYGEV